MPHKDVFEQVKFMYKNAIATKPLCMPMKPYISLILFRILFKIQAFLILSWINKWTIIWNLRPSNLNKVMESREPL